MIEHQSLDGMGGVISTWFDPKAIIGCRCHAYSGDDFINHLTIYLKCDVSFDLTGAKEEIIRLYDAIKTARYGMQNG